MLQGSYRYGRINTAVNDGATGPPLDMRYIKRTETKAPEATSECISFLEGIYQSVAETLPDIRDSSISTTLVDSPSLLETDDSYRAGVTLDENPQPKISAPKCLGKKKGPRKFKAGMRVNRDRHETKEIRFLPPGKMKDYYEMMLSQRSGGGTPASFATFYRAPWRLMRGGICCFLW